MTEIVEKPVVEPSARISKLKVAFLYVLIGGLAASALISVIALLMGHFNSALLKALGTIFIFFTHGLFILALLWADRDNQVGKLLLPTTILVLAFSNLITTTLGTWGVISTDTAWHAFGFYFLVLGAAYMISGILKLRLNHQPTQIALYTSIGLVGATTVLLAPWVLQIITNFDPLYYRVVAALSILATASFLIGLILRGIALGHDALLKATQPAKTPTSGGLLAIYIVIGTITAFVWFVGFAGFLVSGVYSTYAHNSTDTNQYY